MVAEVVLALVVLYTLVRLRITVLSLERKMRAMQQEVNRLDMALRTT
jgi:hypothetical protein